MLADRTQELAEELYCALKNGRTIAPLTDGDEPISLDEAYYVSLALLNLRLERNGERVIGKKIGVTSEVVQKMLGVDQPDFGFLTNTMHFTNGAKIPLENDLIQPKIEAEIGFRLATELRGPGVSEQDVLHATENIMPCFEVVDSRIRDWKITIADTIADNASCGVFVLGEAEVDPRGLSLPELEVEVFKNGEHLSSGFGSAALGNPLTAVAWLANTLGKYGISLNAGDIILSGSLVPLEPAITGDHFRCELRGIGSVECSFA